MQMPRWLKPSATFGLQGNRLPNESVLLFCTLALGGCVTPVPVGEQGVSPSYVAEHSVLVSVIDERAELREGKPPDFIGRMHLAFGIPADMAVYPIVTEDKAKKGQSLAAAIEERIVDGFTARGWTAFTAGFASKPKPEQYVAAIQQKNAELLLLLTLDRWFVSVNTNWVTAFNFDWGVRVQVFDDNGSRLVDFEDSGRDVVDAEYNQSYANHIRLAYKDRLTKILEDPRVRDVLIGVSVPSTQ